MGGVYNVINLHTYHYAGNNPLKYTDPDGRSGEFDGPVYSNSKWEREYEIFRDFVMGEIKPRTEAEKREFENSISPGWVALTEEQYSKALTNYVNTEKQTSTKRGEINDLLVNLNIKARELDGLGLEASLATILNCYNAYLQGGDPESITGILTDLKEYGDQFFDEINSFNSIISDIHNKLSDYTVLKTNEDYHAKIFFAEYNRRKKWGL
jgi:hypothetical protein